MIAGRLGENGVSVAIEERLVGGEYPFFACMAARRAFCGLVRSPEARRVPGVAVGGELDAAAVLACRDEIVHDLDDTSMVPRLEERSVTRPWSRPARR